MIQINYNIRRTFWVILLFSLSACFTCLRAQEEITRKMNSLIGMADFQGTIDYANEVLREPSTSKNPSLQFFACLMPLRAISRQTGPKKLKSTWTVQRLFMRIFYRKNGIQNCISKAFILIPMHRCCIMSMTLWITTKR